MTQPVVEIPVMVAADTPANKQPVPVLVRLWDEAERAVAVQRQPKPTPRRVEAAEQPTRVRYAYD